MVMIKDPMKTALTVPGTMYHVKYFAGRAKAALLSKPKQPRPLSSVQEWAFCTVKSRVQDK